MSAITTIKNLYRNPTAQRLSGITVLLGAAKWAWDNSTAARDGAQKVSESPKSVTEFNKKGTIESRVYLDSLIANEAVIHPLLMSLQNLYISYIANTFMLNEYISDGYKVSDALNIIATEDRHDDPDLYNNLITDFANFVGMEANISGLEDDNEEDEFARRQRNNERIRTNRDISKAVTDKRDKERADADAKVKKDITTKFDDPAPPKNPLPEGRQIAITMTARNKETITVNLMIILKPYYIKQELVKEMIKLDTNPSTLKRYFQWRAGEIAFMRDFIFQLDQIKHRSKTARSDESGTLLDYIDTQTLKGRKRLIDFFKAFDSKKALSSNVANNILIFSEDAVKRAKADSAFDLHKTRDRNSYFQRTYAMFICVIDPMYNKVYLYMNGYDNGATYSYSDFTNRSKDTADIKSILETISQNRMPAGGRF